MCEQSRKSTRAVRGKLCWGLVGEWLVGQRMKVKLRTGARRTAFIPQTQRRR